MSSITWSTERFFAAASNCGRLFNPKIAARILAVADTFDAMTSDNEYRPANSYEYALSEIDNGTGTQFDPDVVAAFKEANEKHKNQWPLSQKKHLVESAWKLRLYLYNFPVEISEICGKKY